MMDTLNAFCEFKPFSMFFLVVTDLWDSLNVCFPLTQYVSNFQYINIHQGLVSHVFVLHNFALMPLANLHHFLICALLFSV